MQEKRSRKFAAMVMLVPIAIAIACAIVMALWNALVPAIFKLPAIGFWQAAGLLLLARILFGGRGPGFWRARHRWRERLANLSPEERERLREGWCRRSHDGEAKAG